ncbi:MAG: ABC transporter substrate-binding protein [Haloarculaceae archaeon]
MEDDQTRRRFLTAAGASAVTVIAGCTGGGNSTPTDEGDGASNGGDGGGSDGGGDGASGGDGGGDGESTGTGGDGGDGTATAGGSGGTLQMMASGAIQTLDPINAKGSGAGYDQYGRSLMEFENGIYPPKPALAKSYDVSDDGLTYTFTLKEGVKFHDGSELTASDVVYSYRRLAESENSRNKDDIVGDTLTVKHEKDKTLSDPKDETTLADVVPKSLAVEAVDEYTFRMELEKPFQYTLSQIAGGAFAVLPENAVGDVEGYEGEYEYNEFFSTANGGPRYAGLGPFEVDSWTKGSQIRLSAFDGYYGDGPELDGITYTVVGSANTRLDRFENGNADILEDMPAPSFNPSKASIEKRKGDREIGTYTLDGGTEVNYGVIPSLSTEYIVFNCLKVPIAVRKAFAYLIDPHDIVKNVYKGTAKPGYHITPPAPYPTFEEGIAGEESYDRHAKSGYKSNTEYGADGFPYGYGETRIDDAKAAMKEAGYGPDNRYSVTATTIAGSDAYRKVFTRLQSKARAAYVDLEITEATFGTIIGKAIGGKMPIFGLGDGMEYPGPQNFLRFLHGGSPKSAFTRWGAEGSYYDEEVFRTARQAWKEQYEPNQGDSREDRMARNEAFQTIEETNWASVQELPFAHSMDQRFWHDHVDVEMYGVMENQTFDDVTLNR